MLLMDGGVLYPSSIECSVRSRGGVLYPSSMVCLFWFIPFFLFVIQKVYFIYNNSARLTKTLAMFRFVFDIAIPESNSWRPLKTKQNSFSRALIYRCVSSCIHWRPWRAEVYFFISISKNNTIYKSLQGLQGHHEHTRNQTETRLKTLV